MRKIPINLREEMANDKYYKVCARKSDGNCNGRITFEHAIIYAGQQLNKKWAIIPLCEAHHAVNRHQDGKLLNKEINICIALNRASESELKQISKVINYKRERDRLNQKYGY